MPSLRHSSTGPFKGIPLDISMVLVDLLNSHKKGWFPHLALLVEEPLELPILWNLLVQPQIRNFTGV